MSMPFDEALTRLALRWLKVPPEPHLPAGDPRSARVFRAGLNYWRLKLFGWTIQQLAGLIGLVAFFVMLRSAPWAVALVEQKADPHVSGWIRLGITLLQLLEPFALISFVLAIPVSYKLRRLDYELRWYIVTDRAARLREGVLSLNEMTFTLANVQDIAIKQGPLQRLLGLADVELRTAGGGTQGPHGQGNGLAKDLHLACFRMVDNAQEIRDLVRERMRTARDAGLGDPDDLHHGPEPGEHPAAVPADSGLHAALQRLRAEGAALRRAAAAHGASG
jgi:membrane protein YdbS with pleckstrin-like domain